MFLLHQVVNLLDLGVPASSLGFEGGVDCEISHRLERGMKHSL